MGRILTRPCRPCPALPPLGLAMLRSVALSASLISAVALVAACVTFLALALVA